MRSARHLLIITSPLTHDAIQAAAFHHLTPVLLVLLILTDFSMLPASLTEPQSGAFIIVYSRPGVYKATTVGTLILKKDSGHTYLLGFSTPAVPHLGVPLSELPRWFILRPLQRPAFRPSFNCSGHSALRGRHFTRRRRSRCCPVNAFSADLTGPPDEQSSRIIVFLDLRRTTPPTSCIFWGDRPRSILITVVFLFRHLLDGLPCRSERVFHNGPHPVARNVLPSPAQFGTVRYKAYYMA